MSTEKLLEKVDLLLGTKSDHELIPLLSKQDFHVLAEVIDALHSGKRKTFALLPPEKQAEVAVVMNEDSKKRVLARLSDATIARFLHFMAEDEATDILQHLEPNKRELVLALMKEDKRRKIQKLLHYGSETAGGLMDLNFLAVDPKDAFNDVIDRVRKHVEGKRDMPTVVVVNQAGGVLGCIVERKLLFPAHSSTADSQMQPIPAVHHGTDRERVMQIMSQMRTEIVAVADESGSVLGVIHLRDLMRVAQAEATEDIYRFAGVDVEEHPLDPVLTKVKRRYNWLLLNLVTAFMAAFVVSLFEDTIARFAILAVYMPIVAGQGGNAATQALAVVVRGLAMNEITWDKARGVVFREAGAGIVNGLITGLAAAGAAIAFGAPLIFGVILPAAMVINLFVAGFFGALIPFLLKRLKIDPAVASSVFVTTTTDVVGFFAFLGLGSILMK
ncbi:MAG: magnesium transporter [Candidatus Peribacteraceae bacterium]